MGKMKKPPAWGWKCGAVLVFASFLAAGCSRSEPPAREAPPGSPVDLSTAGSVRVEVLYDGPVPTPREISMQSAPQCAAMHPEAILDPSLVVNGGRVKNALVWVKSGLEGHSFSAPPAAVVIDQKGCMFEPRVVGVMVGQAVEFGNSDPEPHNVHGHPQVVRGWNFMLARKGSSRQLTFDKPEVGIPVVCDIHPWMRAYVGVFPHPYFAVTSEAGEAVFERLPPGQYRVAAWHEVLGTLEQEVTVPARGTAGAKFVYSKAR